jgi:DNA-binding NarL/FixJ family response regulator
MGDCGTILVVDHDDTARSAAVQAAVRLGYEVTALENAERVFARLDHDPPVLAILEVDLPGATSGLALLGELHDRYGPDLPVILVSAERNMPLDRVAGLLLGADDYVAKPFDGGELAARIRRSLRRSAGNRHGGGRNGVADGRDVLHDGLSPRELEILRLLAEGSSQTDIAGNLAISPKTVATHIQRVLSKLGVHSRAGAVAAAYQRGLVEPDVNDESAIVR